MQTRMAEQKVANQDGRAKGSKPGWQSKRCLSVQVNTVETESDLGRR
jgi:hypothetical protein